MTAKETTAFMTNREMIREMYERTKHTDEVMNIIKVEMSVLKTVQESHSGDIKSLKTWRNINASAIVTAIGAIIGFKP